MYADLRLPWEISEQLAHLFPEEGFLRREWNRDGKLEPNETQFFGESSTTTLGELAASLGTASMVTRWREANPEMAHTDDDCVAVTIRSVAEAMSPGIETAGVKNLTLSVGPATTLLLFTRA